MKQTMTIEEMKQRVLNEVQLLAQGDEDDLQWLADIVNFAGDSNYIYNPNTNTFENKPKTF
jgi:hypothetical protein